VFKMGKSSQKGKERLDDEAAGISPSTSASTGMELSPVRPKAFERSLTDPSYFPPVGVHDPPIGNGNGGTSDTQGQGQGHAQTNRDLTGLGQIRDMRRNDSIVTHTTSSSSGEQARKYSTTGSSHSSNIHGNGNLAGSSSISQSSINGSGPGQPARSPGSTGFGGFKSRFFSNPSKTGAKERDASPDRELSASTSTSTSIAGENKYKGVGIGIGGTGREVSIGSSSLSPSDISPEKSLNGRGNHPRTPNRQNLHPSPTPREDHDSTAQTQTPTKSSGSAATRWLRRVVSAPNTKALLSPNRTTIPPVPPVPTSATQPHTPSSPVIVITSQDHATESPTNDDEPVSPTKRNTPSPHKPPIGSSLNPGGVTRGQRAATISSGAKAKDIQAQLGIGGPGVSHHKQVFRRTYSSNSIKTRSVSFCPCLLEYGVDLMSRLK
jgi:protein-serine/threonine kinase